MSRHQRPVAGSFIHKSSVYGTAPRSWVLSAVRWWAGQGWPQAIATATRSALYLHTSGRHVLGTFTTWVDDAFKSLMEDGTGKFTSGTLGSNDASCIFQSQQVARSGTLVVTSVNAATGGTAVGTYDIEFSQDGNTTNHMTDSFSATYCAALGTALMGGATAPTSCTP